MIDIDLSPERLYVSGRRDLPGSENVQKPLETRQTAYQRSEAGGNVGRGSEARGGARLLEKIRRRIR